MKDRRALAGLAFFVILRVVGHIWRRQRYDMSVNDYKKSPLSWMPDKAIIDYPQYLSLAAALERDIANGTLATGAKLPPQRALADYLDLNLSTVTRAYDLCREKNLIYGETGRGTYVSPTVIAPQTQAVAEFGVVLGFPTMTQPVVQAAQRVILQANIGSLFGYMERAGMRHQREAGVQWMRKFGVLTDVEHSAIFAGTQSAIATALVSLFRVGDAIAVDELTYANLIETARLSHLRLVPIAGDADGMCPFALDEACRKSHIRGLFVMPNCANPTTISLSETRRDAVAEICARHHLTIIEDDALVLPDPARRSLFTRLPDQTLYLSGSTRMIAPGLRIAFAAFPQNLSQPLLNGLYHTTIKASALDAEIIAEMLTSGQAETILREKADAAVRANAIFDRIFPDATPPGEKWAMFRRLMTPNFASGLELESRLLEHGLRVCHAYRFAVDKAPHDSFLRISISSAPCFQSLEHGLMRLKTLLSKFNE